ncbi:MAG: hypothetical protein D3X82_17615 [Candidatus Leucobacter sulfamidivorax]|nr:hypothetical protein [Candidatus Leucobacter sulfamidivorax]
MASQQYRRPRGTPKVALNLFVAPEVKELIDTYSKSANAPIWAIVEAAIRSGKPGPDGIPEGWDLPVDGDALPGLRRPRTVTVAHDSDTEGGSISKTA